MAPALMLNLTAVGQGQPQANGRAGRGCAAHLELSADLLHAARHVAQPVAASRAASTAKPRPLSAIAKVNSPPLMAMRSHISVAPEWRAALFKASLATRNTLCRTSVVSGTSGRSAGTSSRHRIEVGSRNSLARLAEVGGQVPERIVLGVHGPDGLIELAGEFFRAGHHAGDLFARLGGRSGLAHGQRAQQTDFRQAAAQVVMNIARNPGPLPLGRVEQLNELEVSLVPSLQRHPDRPRHGAPERQENSPMNHQVCQ